MRTSTKSLTPQQVNPLVSFAETYIMDEPAGGAQEGTSAASALKIVEDWLWKRISEAEAKSLMVKAIGSADTIDKLSPIVDLASGRPPIHPIEDIVQGKYAQRCRVWTQLEDTYLIAAIYRFGVGSWKLVSDFVGHGKTRSQCSQRWYRALDPCISKSPWTDVEDNTLLDLVKSHGEHNWSKISKMMNKRSDVQCRYRYNVICKASRPAPFEKFDPTAEIGWNTLLNRVPKLVLPSISSFCLI